MKLSRLGGSYSLSPRESQRISGLKFISILLVVMIHAYDMDLAGIPGLKGAMNLQYLISQILARSAVPLFFLLSGVLLFKSHRSYSSVLKNKARTLLLPYILWNSFWILVFIVLQSLPFTSSLFSGDSVPILKRTPLQWLQLFGIGAQEPQDYPLWFLRDLMVMVVVSPLIWGLADRFPRFSLGISLAGILLLPDTLVFHIAVPYMLLSACIVKLNLRADSLDRLPLAVWLAIYGVGILGSFFFRILPLQRLVQLTGVLFWIRFSAAMGGRTQEQLIKGSETVFMIFAAHELTLTFLRKLWGAVLPRTSATVLTGYFLLPLLVIFLCMAADRLLARFLPRFRRVITGGR